MLQMMSLIHAIVFVTHSTENFRPIFQRALMFLYTNQSDRPSASLASSGLKEAISPSEKSPILMPEKHMVIGVPGALSPWS